MDVAGAVSAIKEAVYQGRISMDMIDYKVRKILMAKSWVGLDQYAPVSMINLVEDLNSITSDILNYKLNEKSITCLKNENDLLPVKDLTKKMAVLSIESEEVSDFYRMINNYLQTDYFYLPKNAGDSLISATFSALANYDIILASVHLINIRASNKYGLTPVNTKLLAYLAQKENVILCILGNPFILSKIPELAQCKSLVMAYQQSKYTENATAQVVLGALAASGKLPVEINADFRFGMNVTWEKMDRLTYGIPELVGIDRYVLNNGIDSLVRLGLKEDAFPGAVVQIAMVSSDNKKGVVVRLSCETDFVSKNEEFINLTKDITKIALDTFPSDLETLYQQEMNGLTLQTIVAEQVARIGEKIEIADYQTIQAPLVTSYIHMGNKAGVLVGLNLEDNKFIDAGRDVAMQVAAMKPVALDKDDVPQEIIQKEIEIGKEIARQEGKAEEMLEKIAVGKLNKFFKDNTLLNQIFVKDGKISVAEFLKSKNPELTAIGFRHIKLG